MKLTMQKHKDGFYISSKEKLINVPNRFMKKDPFQETWRFLYLLGFEMEKKPNKEK